MFASTHSTVYNGSSGTTLYSGPVTPLDYWLIQNWSSLLIIIY